MSGGSTSTEQRLLRRLPSGLLRLQRAFVADRRAGRANGHYLDERNAKAASRSPVNRLEGIGYEVALDEAA